MPRSFAATAAVVAVIGVVAAVAVSRHTTTRTIDAAASARQQPIVGAADLDVWSRALRPPSSRPPAG